MELESTPASEQLRIMFERMFTSEEEPRDIPTPQAETSLLERTVEPEPSSLMPMLSFQRVLSLMLVSMTAEALTPTSDEEQLLSANVTFPLDMARMPERPPEQLLLSAWPYWSLLRRIPWSWTSWMEFLERVMLLEVSTQAPNGQSYSTHSVIQQGPVTL